MKIKKITRAMGAAILLLFAGGSTPSMASWYDSPSAFDKSVVVVISSSMVTGATALLTGSNVDAYVYLYAPATPGVTGEMIAIASSVSVSTLPTTGSFRFPVNQLFTIADFKGPIWALAVGTSTLNVSVLRKH